MTVKSQIQEAAQSDVTPSGAIPSDDTPSNVAPSDSNPEDKDTAPRYLTQDYETILVDLEGPTAIITLNRMAKYNALNAQMRFDLADVLTQLAADRAVRAIILWGGTKAFIAGADVKELLAAKPLDVFARMSPNPDIWRIISDLPKPVIAAIAGPCVGGGLELAMACDLMVAADNAVLGQSEVNVGLIPGRGGTQRLVHYIGLPRAKRMVMLGEMITAREALEFGLVIKTVPAEELLDTARSMALTVAQKSPQSMAMAKIMMNTGQNVPLDSALTMESLAFAGMFTTDDMREGVDAFLTKRRPNYKGG